MAVANESSWTFRRFVAFARSYGYEFVTICASERGFENSTNGDYMRVEVNDHCVSTKEVERFKDHLRRQGRLRPEDR